MNLCILVYFVILLLSRTEGQISDKRLCIDPKCQEPVSYAKTLLNYNSPDKRILSFVPNADVIIYSKSAGSLENLWGGEINGNRGYVPKNMVRETKVLKKPTLLVDTESSSEIANAKVPLEINSKEVKPDRVKEPYEVLDGTTIYQHPQETITVNPPDNVAQSTTTAPLEKNVQSSTAAPPPVDKNVIEPTTGQPVPKNAESAQIQEKKTEEVFGSGEALPSKEDKLDQQASSKADQSVIGDMLTKLSSWVGDPDEDNEDEYADEDDDSYEDAPKETLKTGDEAVPVDNLKENSNVGASQPIGGSIPEKIPAEVKNSAQVTNDAAAAAAKLGDKVILPEIKVTMSPPEVPQISRDEVIPAEIKATTPPSELPQKLSEEVIPAEIKVTTSPPEVPQETGTKIPEPQVIEKTKVEPVTDKTPEIPVASEKKIVTPDVKMVDAKIHSAVKEEPVIKDDNINKANILVEDSPKAEINKDDTTSSTPEVTTQPSLYDVPEPLLYEEVTPNPIDLAGVKIDNTPASAEFQIPTLTPLGGLFNHGGAYNTELNQGSRITENSDLNYSVENSPISETPQTVDSFSTQEVFKNDTSEEVLSPTTSQENDLSENSGVMSDQSQKQESTDDTTMDNISYKDDATINSDTKEAEEGSPGIISNIFSFLQPSEDKKPAEPVTEEQVVIDDQNKPSEVEEGFTSDSTSQLKENGEESSHESLPTSGPTEQDSPSHESGASEYLQYLFNSDLFNFNPDTFLYLVTTAISVIVFLFGYMTFDKMKREGPLVAKINNLEKELLVLLKENQMLQAREPVSEPIIESTNYSNAEIENLQVELYNVNKLKSALEEQVQSLEKELENSTEVGMELNKMLSEILSSQSGSDVLKSNVEQLHRQLIEQQATINSISEKLAITSDENYELRLELEISNKKVTELQKELDKMCLNVLKIEEEKDQQQNTLEQDLVLYKRKFEEVFAKFKVQNEEHKKEIKLLEESQSQTERKFELKNRELTVTTEKLKGLKVLKDKNVDIKALLDATQAQAEVIQLRVENGRYLERLHQEQNHSALLDKKLEDFTEQVQQLKARYDEADKERTETQTKLDVLSSYFKEKEAQLQRELSKHESLWIEKQGEATSTTERINFLQEQLQNYKTQNESLKQEIIAQEVELKSQISVLQKKVNEHWVSVRQAERKLDEVKQEATQLRHKLTSRERAFQEEREQQRFQSPLEQNGEMPLSPLHGNTSASPLLFGTREHITKSPLSGLPPFLPPPGGVPFMPPPLSGVPPFIPPPPSLFPGDHRPPPLGRMSSPTLNSRFSPSSMGYSPYDRSSSPSDSEYGTSPPRRGFSPFHRGEGRDRDRRDRDYRKPPLLRNNDRSLKGKTSSASGNSNESLEKINRQTPKV